MKAMLQFVGFASTAVWALLLTGTILTTSARADTGPPVSTLLQVHWGIVHGVDRLSLTAARAPDKNGYITWPVFGYDGKIPDRIREAMPERLRAFATIQDLLGDDEGADWWRDEGKTIALTFDLTEGRDNRRWWNQYWTRERRNAVDPSS